MMLAAQRVRLWLKGHRAPPVKLDLHITSNCNLSCRFCARYNKKHDLADEMSEPQLIRVIRDASDLGIGHVAILGGGEPMTRGSTTLKIMKEIKRLGMSGDLITNGTLFSRQMIKEIVDICWDSIHFSLDAPDAKVHDTLRGLGGSFKKTVSTINYFRELKKHSHPETYKRESPLLGMNVVLNNTNYNILEKMYRLAYDLGVTDIELLPLVIFSEHGERLKMNDAQIDYFISEIPRLSALAREFGITTNVEGFNNKEFIRDSENMDNIILSSKNNGPLNKTELPVCFFPWTTMAIFPDGFTGPCSMFGDQAKETVKTTDLAEIWYGPYFDSLRKKILAQELPEPCKKCCITGVEYNDRIKKSLNKKLLE